MAVDQKQLDTDLQILLANVAILINETNLLIAKTTGAQPAPPPAPDFTTEDTGINSANSSVTTAIAAAKAITGQ
jgi:hypothetical protein